MSALDLPENERYIIKDLFLACMCKRNLEVKGTKVLVLVGKELFSRIRRRIDDKDMPTICEFLARNPDVVAVNLAYNNISDKGMKILAIFLEENDSILELNVMNNDITEKGIIRLSEVSNLNLKSLRINGNKIGKEGMKSLAMMLSTNTCLTNLDAGETDMDIGALVYFTTILRTTNTTLQSVNFSRVLGFQGHSLQTDHVIDVIQQMLPMNKTLRELHLQKMGFVDHDIELLIEGLRQNSTILLLDLSCNGFGDYGMERLAEFIGTKPPLQTLLVTSNNIGDAGARSLSFKFPYSRITFLDISKNKITEVGLLDILNCLKKEIPIQGLFIRGNQIGEKTCRVLYRMLLSGVLTNHTLDLHLYCEKGKYTYSCSHAYDHLKPHYYCLCSSTQQRFCRHCDVSVVRNKRPVDKLRPNVVAVVKKSEN